MNNIFLPVGNLILSIGSSINRLNENVASHHKRIAYIAVEIAAAMGYRTEAQNKLLMAASLQKIGMLVMGEKIDTFAVYSETPYVSAEYGYRLLKGFKPFEDVAEIIRYHHIGYKDKKTDAPKESLILNFACMIESILLTCTNKFFSKDKIIHHIKMKSDKIDPEMYEAFMRLADKDVFWLNLEFNGLEKTLFDIAGRNELELDHEELTQMARILGKLVDYRSPYTAAHSYSVSVVAGFLAIMFELSIDHCYLMRVAGYMHDLGKISIPIEVMYRPDKLTEEELRIIRAHTFHTNKMLEDISSFELIRSWITKQDERSDGKGGPFKLSGEDIPLGAKIIAVADVFVALKEDRPYRKHFTNEAIIKLMDKMAEQGKLDREVYGVLRNHVDMIEILQRDAAEDATREYEELIEI